MILPCRSSSGAASSSSSGFFAFPGLSISAPKPAPAGGQAQAKARGSSRPSTGSSGGREAPASKGNGNGSGNGNVQRGRPSEDILAKVDKLLVEFKQCVPEHPRFFGAEKRTQAKAFERLLKGLFDEQDGCDDPVHENALKLAKKRVEIVRNLSTGYMKANGFIGAYKEAEHYANIEPVVDLSLFVPGWMIIEKYRLEVGTSSSSAIWGLLATPIMESHGFLPATIESETTNLLADRLVELGRRESTATFPGSHVEGMSFQRS